MKSSSKRKVKMNNFRGTAIYHQPEKTTDRAPADWFFHSTPGRAGSFYEGAALL